MNDRRIDLAFAQSFKSPARRLSSIQDRRQNQLPISRLSERRKKMVEIIPNGAAWSIKDQAGYGATYTTIELKEIRNILNHMSFIKDERLGLKNRRSDKDRRNLTQTQPDYTGRRKSEQWEGRRMNSSNRRSTSCCHKPENRKS